MFGEAVGLIAALLAAISPTMIVFSVLFLSETLFSVALLGSLILLAKLVHTDLASAARRRGIVLALFAGVAIGVACLVRPTWLLVGPGFVLLYVIFSKPRCMALSRGLLLLLGLTAVLWPWTHRNAGVAQGHFVPTTLWVGPSLYDGLNPTTNGNSDMTFIETDRAYQRFSEYDADQFYRRKAWDFVKSNPGRTIELAWLKLQRFWWPWPNAEQFGHWVVRWGVALFFVPTLIFAAMGGWKSRHQIWIWLLPAAPILYFSAVHLVFVSSLRYRLPAEYPFLVLSAVGLYQLLPNRGMDAPDVPGR